MVCDVSGASISVRLADRECSFVPERRSVRLELRGVNNRPDSVAADGLEADWRYHESAGKLVVSLTEGAGELAVQVRA